MTGRFDDTTLGLIALDEVRFERPVVVGTTVRLRMGVLAKRRSTSDQRGSVRFAWTAVGSDGGVYLRTESTMLFALGDPPTLG